MLTRQNNFICFFKNSYMVDNYNEVYEPPRTYCVCGFDQCLYKKSYEL